MVESYELDARHEPDHHQIMMLATDSDLEEVESNCSNSPIGHVVLKLDLILLPFLALLFLANSLDRSNVGNAETANFTADTGLEPGDLNKAVALFFAVFVVLQPLSAACGRRFGMVRFVPSCMALWGVCTILHIYIKARWQLYAIRVVIGVLEAGFYPVTVSYLSLFYTRYEFAKRLGFFYGQYAVAGALGGVLSYAVFSAFPNRPDEGGWKSWQILFLIEGVITIILALIGFFWLPHSPDTAWFLNDGEREWARERICIDRAAMQNPRQNVARFNAEDDPEEAHLLARRQSRNSRMSLPRDITEDSGLSSHDVISAVTEWKVWSLLFLNILSAIPASAFSVFLPLVVKGFGFSANKANLFTAPPFLTGAAVLAIFAWWSDRSNQRLKPVLYGLAIVLGGLTAVVMLPHHAFIQRYIALCILLGGSFIASPLTIAWFTGNIEEPGKRAIVLGINGWGNFAGVFSSLLFAPHYGPDYVTPFFVTLTLVMVSFVGYMLFRSALVRENSARKRLVDQWTEDEVEAERLLGRGPLPVERSLFQRIFGTSRGIGRWLHNINAEGRRGDDKMTFTYAL